MIEPIPVQVIKVDREILTTAMANYKSKPKMDDKALLEHFNSNTKGKHVSMSDFYIIKRMVREASNVKELVELIKMHGSF